MNKFGRDDGWTLAAAAVLTGLLIFTAGREQGEEEGQSDHDRENLAAFRARVPADEPVAVQNARASQPGRGRAAGSPLAVPWLGWKDILWRTWAGITGDHLLTLAGSVAFFAEGG
jgi:membrane protein